HGADVGSTADSQTRPAPAADHRSAALLGDEAGMAGDRLGRAAEPLPLHPESAGCRRRPATPAPSLRASPYVRGVEQRRSRGWAPGLVSVLGYLPHLPTLILGAGELHPLQPREARPGGPPGGLSLQQLQALAATCRDRSAGDRGDASVGQARPRTIAYGV